MASTRPSAIDRPHPEELRAGFLQRLEEAVPRVFAARDREAAALGGERRQHVLIEHDAADRQAGDSGRREKRAAHDPAHPHRTA